MATKVAFQIAFRVINLKRLLLNFYGRLYPF